MKLRLVREVFTKKSTIGSLYINEQFECYTLEDTDRKIEEVGCSGKVYGETCIPRGAYYVTIDWSPHYNKNMPHVYELDGEEVKCFSGIRIHIGNSPADTDGCILVGTKKDDDFIEHSADAFKAFVGKLTLGLKDGPVTLEVV